MKSFNRRKFIQSSALLSGGILLSPASFVKARSQSPNETLNFGLIGAKGMGWSNMRSLLGMKNVNCIGIADVDQNVLDQRLNDYKGYRQNIPKQYGDYRKMLENKDIDAVVIGTPDHWHCKMMIDALDAGKHVYVEKPMANSIEECYLMLNAANIFNKQVVQVGQWQRSGPHYQEAIKMVRSGSLGNIRLVKVWAYQGWMGNVAVKADSTVPKGVDYKMWLGPAPLRPFNVNRFHFNFRWFWDYAGGLMTDWGVHEIDIALYAMDVVAPKSVIASGGKFAYPDDASETPDTLQAVFDYGHFNMLWEHASGIDGGNYGRTEGIAFIGNKGTLVVDRGGYELIPETGWIDGKRQFKIPAIPDFKRNGNHLDIHTKNFVQAIKDGDPSKVNCGAKTGSVAAINAHMGNIAFKTGRKIYWDQANKSFKNDAEANQLASATYHNGWKKPSLTK